MMRNLWKNYLVMIMFAVTSLSSNAGVRKLELINTDWSFKIGEQVGAEKTDYNAADWQKMTLPHNWGYEKAQAGDNNFYRGPGWYRKVLDVIPKEGKRYFVRFEAVGSVADVYLNGKLLGQHRGAFSAFTFEITKYLSVSGKNIIAVRASNAQTSDVAPLGGDFNIYGGIYRSVTLIETAEVCFNLTDYASPGVKWLQTKVNKDKAVLDVEAWVSNGAKEGLPFTFTPKELGQVLPEGLYNFKATVKDAKGNIVESIAKQINITAGNTIPFYTQLEIRNPHLWNGTLDPYLYTAVLELYKGDVLVDAVNQPLGIRSIRIDPEKGFFLNDAHYRIKGVSKHQDRQDKGWAVSKEDLDEDMALLKEMGANAVRCAHYQHSDYWMDLCDKNGILVWAEIGQVGVVKNTEAFARTSRDQWLELIRQNINHPSIFAWGMFNEVRIENVDPHRQFVDLKGLANSEDPTRPTVAATSHAQSPEMNKIPDLLGWNRYPGWYDKYADLKNDTLWNKYAVTSKNGGFCFSEYGAGANIEHHEQHPEQPIPGGFWHPEEWQSKVHEAAWESYMQKPYIWGSFVWNMFDFSAAKRNEGGKKGINDKGLVTFDRKTRKDAFYFYKANWNKAPMIYLTSKRHLTRNEAFTPVKVYCNINAEVSLVVNGKLIGKQLPNTFKIVVWENVKLKKGKNKVTVTVKDNTKIMSDEVVWIYDSNSKSLKPEVEKAKIIKGDGGFGQ